jgi:iron complex outermembrane receptor protein
MKKLITISFVTLVSMGHAMSQSMALASSEAPNIMSMSIEELLQIKVSTISSHKATTEDKAPSVVKVITKDEIQALGTNRLSDVLETIPGIHLDRAHDNMNYLHIGIRGIYANQNQQVLVLFNGKRRKDSFQSSAMPFRRRFYPTYNIKRIEVIKGPGSAIYGADAVAGVINIVTEGPDDYEGLEVGLNTGSFQTNGVYVKYADKINHLKYSIAANHFYSEIDNAVIDKDVQSSFDSIFGTSASQAPGRIRGHWKDQMFETKLSYKNFDFTYMYSRFDAYKEYGSLAVVVQDSKPLFGVEARARLRYHNNITEKTNYEVSFTRDNYQQRFRDIETLYPAGVSLGGPTFGEGGLMAKPEFSENADSIDFKIISNEIKNHSLSFGTGLLHSDIFEIKEHKNFSGAGIPRGTIVDVTDTDEIYMPEISRTSNYLFTQDDITLTKKLTLVAGIRWDNYNDFGSSTNPRGSLIYNMTEKLTSRLIYGKAFRAPNLYELHSQNNPVNVGNKDLQPEKIEYYEIANSYHANENLKLNFNIFKYQFTEIIDLVNFKYENIGKYYGEGFEFSLLGKVNEGLKVEIGHTYTMVLDQNDERSPKLAHNQSTASVNYQFLKNWSVNLQQYFISSIARSPADPREDRDPYAYMDLAIKSPQFWDHYHFQLRMKNVFDENLKYTSNPVAGANALNQPSDSSAGRRSFYLFVKGKF